MIPAPRPSLCPFCRTALDEDEECAAHPGVALVRLDAPRDRAALQRELRPPRRRWRHAVAGLAAWGAFTLIIWKTAPAALEVMLWVSVPFLAFVAVVAAFKAGRRLPPATLQLSAARGIAGEILPGDTITSPARGEPCVAYAVTALARDEVRLRDAESAGFSVKLEDGRTVRFPKGRIWIDAPMSRLDELTRQQADDWLHRGVLPTDSLYLFAQGEVYEVLVRPGESIELTGELEEVPDPGAAQGGFRDAPATIWRPRGAPTIRLR